MLLLQPQPLVLPTLAHSIEVGTEADRDEAGDTKECFLHFFWMRH